MDEGRADKRRSILTAAALVAGGAVAGAVLAGTISAGAAPTPSPRPSGGTEAQERPGGGGPGGRQGPGGPCGGAGRGGHRLDLNGTVTAVGTTTVTIKPATGAAKTYTVTSASDIDKNGEAQLSSLAVGDTVRFSVRPGTSTIDVLHAGDEAKNRPAGPPHGAPPSPGATPPA